jgi:signal transduction histidine kinase
MVKKRGINLNLPAAEFSAEIDPMLIVRVLVNLLSNAIKYSPENAEISLGVTREGTKLRFTVSDTGPGMEPKEQQKLFQKFGQASAADGVKRAGTGLGLISCKSIVEAHGGEIGCTSEPGKGSCFWFTVPVQAAQPDSDNDDSQNKKSSSRRSVRGSITTKFAVLLLLFLGVQGLAFVTLRSNLSESISRATQYVDQKKILFDTQELFALFLFWGKKTEAAIDNSNYLAALGTVPLLKEQMGKTKQILAQVEPGPVSRKLTQVLAVQEDLMAAADYAKSHMDEMGNRIEDLMKLAHDGGYRLEERLDELIELENETVQASYDWLKKQNFQTLLALVLSALADLIVIGVAAHTGWRIVQRIGVLKEKSEAFGRGEPISASLSGNDELSHLDKRLCQISSELRIAEIKRQELLAVINHDLSTPLTSILLSLEMLSSGSIGKMNETDSEMVQRSEYELERMIAGVNDLLTIEKIDAGKIKMHSKRLHLFEILDESSYNVIRELKAKGAQLSMEPENLINDAQLVGDQGLLVKLCAIILINAIEASPTGEKVLLTLEEDKDSLVMNVKDHGPGIKPELLPEIFERFRFLDGKPVPGLGLPLAQRLCQLHGGSIQIKASNASGTQVEIMLPR